MDYETRIEQLKRGNVNERAAALILELGGFDGAQHKQYALDQVLRVLAGSEYDSLIKIYERDGEYEWETGVAP